MTDISGLLKSTMQNENCSSLCAFLLLKGEYRDDEQLSIQQRNANAAEYEYATGYEYDENGKKP